MATRPKRKLIIVPELVKVFSATVIGQKWSSNRELHREFEQQLINFGWKTGNLSNDGSGARTYASLLFMLGLWYEDGDGVKLSKAGEELVKDEPPVPILTKQLINFQYPSAYSVKSQVNIDRTFKIKPHLFLINILLDGTLAQLSQNEIAYCVIPFAKVSGDLKQVVARVLAYRAAPENITDEAVRVSGTTRDNLENIANTFINQLEYTGFFEERDSGDPILRFTTNGSEEAREAIAKYEKNTVFSTDDGVTFQKRYGSGLLTSKDYSGVLAQPQAINPNERVALLAFYEISLLQPIDGITEELIKRISASKGIPISTVRKVLSNLTEQPLLDRFEETYIKLSKGGTETAKDFEIRTNGVLSVDGFGLASQWVGPSPRHPDIFVYFDRVNKKHGIIDTKAYKEYNLPLDHKNKMAYTYVPLYKELVFEGEKYSLAFFSYVAGGFGSGISKSFSELVDMVDGVPGSYITSYSFMRLLRIHRSKALSPEDFGRLFSCNGEIDYEKAWGEVVSV